MIFVFDYIHFSCVYITAHFVLFINEKPIAEKKKRV